MSTMTKCQEKAIMKETWLLDSIEFELANARLRDQKFYKSRI